MVSSSEAIFKEISASCARDYSVSGSYADVKAANRCARRHRFQRVPANCTSTHHIRCSLCAKIATVADGKMLYVQQYCNTDLSDPATLMKRCQREVDDLVKATAGANDVSRFKIAMSNPDFMKGTYQLKYIASASSFVTKEISA